MFLEKLVIAIGLVLANVITGSGLFEIGGVNPDFILIFTIFFALRRGAFAGIWIGFFGGLLTDADIGLVVDPTGAETAKIGLHALAYSLVGFGFGRFLKNIYRESWAAATLVVLVGGFLARLLVYMNYNFFWGDIAGYSLLPTAAYSAVLAPMFFYSLAWLYKMEDPGEGF